MNEMGILGIQSPTSMFVVLGFVLLIRHLYEGCFFLLRPVPMERESPDRSSPDSPQSLNTGTHLLDTTSSDHDHQITNSMSVVVAAGHVPNMPGPVGGVNKRYRPAPAKTFQCRGYGDCRMVFSRSEHLARHIRYAISQNVI
jgi:hypothetical protein